MAWALGACAALLGCGGKARGGDASDGSNGSGGSGQQPSAKACFALPSDLPSEVLIARAAQKLGAELTDAAGSSVADPDGFVRAQQLVDLLDGELRGTGSAAARQLLHDFIVKQLMSSPRPEGGRGTLPPGLSESVAAAMDSELDRSLNHWLVAGQGTLAALLTDDTAYANRELADHYGIGHSPGNNDWEPLQQPTATRAGVLTLGAFLTRFRAPMTRASQLSKALSCETVPPPPVLTASVWGDPMRAPAKVIVETQYGQGSSCEPCHKYYVGFGVALDTYDELGRYRATLGGQPIDTSYYLDTGGGSGDDARRFDFANPHELGAGLARSPAVRACLTESLNEFLGGRELTHTELDCVVGELDNRQVSFWSLLAILAPEYLLTAP